jgi:hypothetical protein
VIVPYSVGEEPTALTSAAVQPSPASRAGANSARHADRFASINTFADCSLRRLGRAELAVWLLLWRDTKPDGVARSAQADLARRAGVNPRTVGRALLKLRTAGLIEVVARGGLGRGPSSYRVRGLIHAE